MQPRVAKSYIIPQNQGFGAIKRIYIWIKRIHMRHCVYIYKYSSANNTLMYIKYGSGHRIMCNTWNRRFGGPGIHLRHNFDLYITVTNWYLRNALWTLIIKECINAIASIVTLSLPICHIIYYGHRNNDTLLITVR